MMHYMVHYMVHCMVHYMVHYMVQYRKTRCVACSKRVRSGAPAAAGHYDTHMPFYMPFYPLTCSCAGLALVASIAR